MSEPARPNPWLLRRVLPMKAVQVVALDENDSPIGVRGGGTKTASGFVRREAGGNFLYACWHTVTGIDRNDPRIPPAPVTRPRAIRVRLQNVEEQGSGQKIGGLREVTVPLYRADRVTPAWLQDRQHVPHPELNAIGLAVPALFDAVKLRLPDDVLVSDLQLVTGWPEEEVAPLNIGSKLLIVGYPYGYSVLGAKQPAAVVLTRYIAATRFSERQHEMLLDGDGAPGMSGGPVFLDAGEAITPIGIYTGNITPGRSEVLTLRLGTFANLQVCWRAPDMFTTYDEK